MTESAAKPPGLKKKVLSPKQRTKHNFSLGLSGEAQAVEFLQNKGYQILATNIRHKNRELDIVALDEELDELVFIEVKTRAKGYYGDPSQAVDKNKIRAMQYVGAVYRRQHKLNKDYRFDIITVLPGRIQHYQNVTWNRY